MNKKLFIVCILIIGLFGLSGCLSFSSNILVNKADSKNFPFSSNINVQNELYQYNDGWVKIMYRNNGATNVYVEPGVRYELSNPYGRIESNNEYHIKVFIIDKDLNEDELAELDKSKYKEDDGCFKYETKEDVYCYKMLDGKNENRKLLILWQYKQDIGELVLRNINSIVDSISFIDNPKEDKEIEGEWLIYRYVMYEWENKNLVNLRDMMSDYLSLNVGLSDNAFLFYIDRSKGFFKDSGFIEAYNILDKCDVSSATSISEAMEKLTEIVLNSVVYKGE